MKSPPSNAATLPAASDLDIGVIYTHERHLMAPLLSSLAESSAGLDAALTLVDNDSAEGVGCWLDFFPNTRVVHNGIRLGYAANLNRILAHSTARYVLLLNTDVWFDPGERCLVKMVRFMDAHPRCGVSICRLYHADGSYAYPARRFQTLRSISARRLGLRHLFSNSLSQYLYLDRSPYDAFSCDWVSGCFLLVRRQAIDEVGRFDCGFSKYFEDVDFCLRMARAGWQVMFNGETYCYHHEQRASKRVFSADGWHHVKSYLRWIQKWGLSPASGPPRDDSRQDA